MTPEDVFDEIFEDLSGDMAYLAELARFVRDGGILVVDGVEIGNLGGDHDDGTTHQRDDMPREAPLPRSNRRCA